MLRGGRKLLMVSKIFETIAQNTTFYLAYGFGRTRLLTDLVGETILLQDMGHEDEKITESTLAMRGLSHTLPLLDDLSLATLLRIRKEDRESFAAYRFEIANITAEALKNGLSEDAAQEFFRSRVEPRVNKIKQELHLERSKQTQNLVLGTAGLAVSVAIGACGLPMFASLPIAATAAAVGTKLITKGVEQAIDSRSDSIKENDLYFLVRLLQEAQ